MADAVHLSVRRYLGCFLPPYSPRQIPPVRRAFPRSAPFIAYQEVGCTAVMTSHVRGLESIFMFKFRPTKRLCLFAVWPSLERFRL